MIQFREALLPNLLVPIDLHDGVPTVPSLFALSEGRRVAHAAGVTVFAVVMTDRHLDEKIAARLGPRRARTRSCPARARAWARRPSTSPTAPALYAAVERVPPLLVLFPAGGAGRAARARGWRRGWAAPSPPAPTSSWARRRPPGRRHRAHRSCAAGARDRSSYRRLDPVELERPVVAILPSGGASAEHGSDGGRGRGHHLRRPGQAGRVGALVRGRRARPPRRWRRS